MLKIVTDAQRKIEKKIRSFRESMQKLVRCFLANQYADSQLPSISLEPEPADLEVNGQPNDKENITSFKGLNLLDVTAPPEPQVFGRVLCSKMWGPFGLTEARLSLGKRSKEPDVNPYDKEVFKRKAFIISARYIQT